MRPLMPTLVFLVMMLAGCLFDERKAPPYIDTRNDHDSALLGKWVSVRWPDDGQWRESFNGKMEESEECDFSGCDKVITPYRTINDTIYQDSVTRTECDLTWNNCKTTVLVPSYGYAYGFYGDTLWLGGKALTFIRE